MSSILNSIFTKIASAVTTVLIAVGLIVSPAPVAPNTDVPADKILEEVTKKQGVGAEKVVSNTPTQPQSNPTPVVAESSPKTNPKSSPKTFITPSGAVVDEFGSIIKLPDPVPQSLPTPTSTVAPATTLQIVSINITPTAPSALIEWQTNQPTASKIFVSVPNALPAIINSASGLSTRHIASIPTSLGRTYLFEIEAITNDGKVVKQTKEFQTPEPAPVIPAPRVINQVLVEVKNSSGAKLQPYSQNTYFLERDKEYFFRVNVLDQEGKAFNDVFVEMRNRDSSQVIDSKYTNTYQDPGIGDWYAFFSYTPRIDTLGRSEGFGFYINYKGSAWSTGIDFNTSFQNPNIELVDPVVPKEVKRADSVRHIFKAKIATEGEPIGIDVVRGEVISNNFPEAGIKVDVYIYIANTNPYSGEGNTFVGSGIIKSGSFAFTLTRFKINPNTINYLRFVLPDITTNTNFSLKITGMEIVGFTSGLYRSISGLPIITPEITLSQ